MKKSYEELEKENRFLRTILDSLSEGIYAVSADGEIIVYNTAMEELENTDRRYVLGYKDKEIYNVFSLDDYMVHELMKTGEPIKNRHYRYQMANGYKVEMAADGYPYYDEKGEYTSAYVIMNDISGTNRLQERIATLNSLLCHNNTELMDTVNSNGTRYNFTDIVGESDEMKDVIAQAKRVSLSFANILIYGETGTGKELFAQSIHNESLHKNGPFVAINCAAIPSTLLESQLFGTVSGAFSDAKNMPGLFEQAENGTVFLDEINSMDIGLQAKLLRVLQEKTVCRLGDKKQIRLNCRVICATNKNPLDADFRSSFREDLLYRLMSIVLFLPPLRNHKSDIDILCSHFIKVFNKRYNASIIEIDKQLRKILMDYSWPGNTRQLMSFLESCFCIVDPKETVLTLNSVPEYLYQQFSINYVYHRFGENGAVSNEGPLNELLENYEKEVIQSRIEKHEGNLSQTAKSLGISRQNMNYKLNKLGIHSQEKKKS